MIRENRTRLYVLAMQADDTAQLEKDAVKHRLEVLALDNGIELTWGRRDLELNYLVNEFLTVRDTFARYDRTAPRRFDLARTGADDLDLPVLDFTSIFTEQPLRSFDQIRDRLRKLAPLVSQQRGQLDAGVLDRLLDQILADPFEDPISFITDLRMGVLDDEAMAQLYARGTGA